MDCGFSVHQKNLPKSLFRLLQSSSFYNSCNFSCKVDLASVQDWRCPVCPLLQTLPLARFCSFLLVSFGMYTRDQLATMNFNMWILITWHADANISVDSCLSCIWSSMLLVRSTSKCWQYNSPLDQHSWNRSQSCLWKGCMISSPFFCLFVWILEMWLC